MPGCWMLAGLEGIGGGDRGDRGDGGCGLLDGRRWGRGLEEILTRSSSRSSADLYFHMSILVPAGIVITIRIVTYF